MLGMLLLGTGMGASAASAAETDESWTVTFSATGQSLQTGPDGDSRTEPFNQDVSLECTAVECSYFERHSKTRIFLSAERPSGQTSWESSGDYCDVPWSGAGTTRLTFANSALMVTTNLEGSGWHTCEGRGQRATWSQKITATAQWIEGEICALTGEACPGAAAEAIAEGSLPSAEPDTGRSTSQLASGSSQAPSILSGLATPAEAGTSPQQLLLAVILTIVLVLLVAFPTSLLNSAVESGSDRFSTWWTSRGEAPSRPPSSAADTGTRWTRSWWWAAVGVVLAAVISAFVDPQFGVNAGSARVVLSIAVSFGIDVVLGWVLVLWLVRRLLPGAHHSFVFRPITLIVVMAAVIFSRVTGFEPGIVFGLVAGVTFATAVPSKAVDARLVLTTTGYAFGAAIVAWVAYGLLGGGAVSGTSFWGTFAVETLSSVAVGGMAALPIILFPLRGLSGHAIWVWNRFVWAGCYAIGLFAFFVVLMPMPFSWAGVGWDLGAWIAVYLCYAAVAVGLWLALTRPWVKDVVAAPTQSGDVTASEVTSDDAEATTDSPHGSR